jgi:uncharacterized protein
MSPFVLTPAPLPEDTEVTGPVAATLWVASSAEDMDLFLTVWNIDADGNDVWEIGQQGQQVCVAKGWLRVSHRECDSDLLLPYRPYHRHTRRLYLLPGEVVKVEVEIWSTSMVFKRPPDPSRYPAARRRRQFALHALSRRLQYRHQHHLFRRR